MMPSVMSVSPVSFSSQVPVGQLASMPAPEALMSDTAAIVLAPLAPLLLFLPVTLSGTLIEQITASSSPGRAEDLSVIPNYFMNIHPQLFGVILLTDRQTNQQHENTSS